MRYLMRVKMKDDSREFEKGCYVLGFLFALHQ